ncbi:hypothetical protein AMAG_02875 [Allomyces macrogynus ATCC 38327]|uniref:UBA domain-containing protein n=1 Tax=Allomyces macrogynus (strain ATCC 38327) TaxID=578462 RepID=A0A0L0S3Y9_ALLM3|nr:hypothetical protein AMAG_02875 [Allomyces macrogynus ATCC 38327]|eukprot:KNE57125.1 hypothetical protein AMAG_02875 [Allomyces macrogynus ATCC 38327]
MADTPPPAPALRILVRAPDGSKTPAHLRAGGSYTDLRLLVAASTALPANELKLVHAGRVIEPVPDDDDAPVAPRYGLRDDSVIFVVRVNPAQQQAAPAGISGEDLQRAPRARDAAADPMDPMLGHPMVQMILSNPTLMRSMMLLDPRLRELAESNPDVARMLDDPTVLRQMADLSRNPAARRELQRQQDRALANIEVMPGGFQALERMYHSTMAPLNDAARAPTTSPSRMSATSPASPSPTRTLNTDPLPNPWAAPLSRSTPGMRGMGPMFGGAARGRSRGMGRGGFTTMADVLARMPPAAPAAARPPVATAVVPPRAAPALPADPVAVAMARYAAQLQHVEDMGFARAAAARALVAHAGDVDAAVNALVMEMDEDGTDV